MADGKTDHKVLVTFAADTTQLRKAMGQVTKDSKKITKENTSAQKTDLKSSKELQKINDQQIRQAKRHRPQEQRDAKERTKTLIAQNKNLREQTTLFGRLRQAAKALYRDERGSISSLFGRGSGGTGGTGGGGTGGGARGGRRTAGGSFLRAAAGSAALNVAGLGLSAVSNLLAMPFGAIGGQYDAARAYRMNLAGLAGYGGAGVRMSNIDALRAGAGQRLGYSAQETIGATRATARATGTFEGAGSAMAFGRLLGEDPTAIASMFGTLRQAGTKGFTEKGAGFKALTQAIAAGMTTGLEKARMPEFLEGVMSLTQRAASREGGDVSSAPFTRLLATLGRSGASGLQGARGAAVASALEEGFTAPGAGEEGMALALSAMGFGRAGPGGGKSYYQARKAVQMGTAGDPDFVKTMIERVNTAYGGGEEANLAIEQMLGGRLSLSQIEEVQKAIAEGGSPEEIARSVKAAAESERDILRDIRNLLSGGDERNNELLKAARRSVEIENENIDAGKDLTEALESIQDTFREFIKQMIDPVKTVMETIAEFLREMRPVLSDVAAAIGDLVKWLARPTVSREERTSRVERLNETSERAAQNVVLAQQAAQANVLLTPEQEQEMVDQISTLLLSSPHQRAEMIRNTSLEERLALESEQQRANLQRMFGMTPDAPELERTSEEASRDMMRGLELLKQLVTSLGMPNVSQSTSRDMLMFLNAQGFMLPESIRAQLNNTGGAQ